MRGEWRLAYRGLTASEVATRVARGEDNSWQPRVGRSYFDILRENVFNVFNLVLFPLLGVILWFGEYSVAFFAGFSVVSNALLGTLQEMMAKRRLDRLVALTTRKARVLRDGVTLEIDVRGLVRDDILPIQPGDHLAVDGRVLASDALELDESQLTGESEAVSKEVGAPLSSGSWCVAGSGWMIATALGADSAINRITQSARSWRNPLTPTQRKVTIVVDITILLMFILVPMLWVAGEARGLDTLEQVKNAVVFISSLVPYGLLLVITIALSLGALRITRHQTLIRRVNAVESLANVDVLCFDKTGTLTENRLAVDEILPLNGEPTQAVRCRLRRYTDLLAHRNGTAAALAGHLRDVPPQRAARKLREIPFSSARQWGALMLEDETLILGAPERLLNGAHGDIARRAQALSAQGLRVLGFARSAAPPQPDRLADSIEPLALVTFSDRVRPDIHATLQAFREQDVALKVISGDNAETVRAVAGAAGLRAERVWQGAGLEALGEAEFATAAQEGVLFARVAPATKRRLVRVLRRVGHVAMVGDGVNDVPALKEADLAIVMNDGARVTREIADILLLNNAMSTLPRAFAEGREITQTIFATVRLFLTKTFYNVLLFVFTGFMALPFAITPVQISWVTFGTVNMVATMVAFRVLRPARMARFRDDVLDYVLTGAFVGASIMALLYALTHYLDGREAARSALAIFMVFFGILIFWHTFGVELRRPRSFLHRRVVALCGLGFLLLTIFGFYARPALLEFAAPDERSIALIVALLLLAIVTLESAMRSRRLTRGLWRLAER